MHTQPISLPTRLLTLLSILIVILAGCSKSPAKDTPTPAPMLPAAPKAPAAVADTPLPASGDYWPTGGWRTSSPEEQGMDAEKLAQALDVIAEREMALHSLLVVRHGYLVSETYFGSYTQDTRHDMYSVTKSFVSTLTGIALDKGYIDSTDQRVVDFFPGQEFDNPGDQKEAMTLEDVLTMRTGLDWNEGDPAYRALYISPDWVEHMLDMPMEAAPGSRFNYCSGCSHLLSAILQQTTGVNPRDFAEENLFAPLGMVDVEWERNLAGTPIGGWGLRLTPREMAKLGYLFLNKGAWDGQQIVSAAWVEQATRNHTGTDGSLGYGYQWWIVPSLKAYTALGLYGQMIMVIPGSDLVIVVTAQMNNHDDIFKLIERYIAPAVK